MLKHVLLVTVIKHFNSKKIKVSLYQAWTKEHVHVTFFVNGVLSKDTARLKIKSVSFSSFPSTLYINGVYWLKLNMH